MSIKNKIDFVLFVSATNANPNGDPLDGNRPRINYGGYGEISDVCIKRKIRNRMQELGKPIFVQSEDRVDDKCKSLKERAERNETLNIEIKKGAKLDKEKCAEIACGLWIDVRTFGQVFPFSVEKKNKKTGETEKDKGKGVSVGVRGPVTIHQGISVSPIVIQDMKITKSVNSESEGKKGRDTMGNKPFIDFGLYKIKGSVNVQLAEKTGFDDEDAKTLKECLRTLFVNDASSARPEGSMEVCKLYWWQHNCRDGQYSSAKVHQSINAILKEGIEIPNSFGDYTVKIEELSGLTPEIIDGI